MEFLNIELPFLIEKISMKSNSDDTSLDLFRSQIISEIDYVEILIIKCKYIYRIIDEPYLINHPNFCGIITSQKEEVIKDKDVIELCKNKSTPIITLSNVIVFKDLKLNDIFDCIEFLKSLEFCDNMSARFISEFSRYVIDSNVVGILSIDNSNIK